MSAARISSAVGVSSNVDLRAKNVNGHPSFCENHEVKGGIKSYLLNLWGPFDEP